MDISIIVPLFNERESLPELVTWIDRVMKEGGYSYELIMVDDGSSDGSWDTVLQLKEKFPVIKGIQFRHLVTFCSGI